MTQDTRPEEIARVLDRHPTALPPTEALASRIRAYGDERAREAKEALRSAVNTAYSGTTCSHEWDASCPKCKLLASLVDGMTAERQRDALDGQAALDEANNHCAAADALLREEREWWPAMLAEAERRLRETPECGASLVEDAWPFMDIIAQLQKERVRKHLEGK